MSSVLSYSSVMCVDRTVWVGSILLAHGIECFPASACSCPMKKLSLFDDSRKT
jgi:hypothetical protein